MAKALLSPNTLFDLAWNTHLVWDNIMGLLSIKLDLFLPLRDHLMANIRTKVAIKQLLVDAKHWLNIELKFGHYKVITFWKVW